MHNDPTQSIHQDLKEEKLVQSDDRLNSILASLDDVVWSLLPETFQTTYMSPVALKVYGRPAEAFYQTPNLWMDIIHAEDQSRVLSEMSHLYYKGVLDLDYRIDCPDGSVRWIHDHVRVISDAANKPLRLDGISVDITKHKLAEQALKKGHKDLNEAYVKLQSLQGQLLQAEKMASIGQLAAGVAHEINNPIGYVYSNLGSLQKYLDDIFRVMDVYEKAEPHLAGNADVLAGIHAIKAKADIAFIREDVAALMSESREGITRVKKIVQDLKDFSHADSEEEWQLADIRHGMESTLNIVNNEIKYKADVIKEYADIPDIECLPPQLNQVFMNLFVNAAHAMEEQRGTITIRTGVKDDNVWIEVKDTGKGIAPENLNRIFDPFFTTKPVGTGTGLGLSVSYSIIKKHHGSIDVSSEVGIGTTFRILLPMKQPAETDA
ncbi:MAG TPA: ATP-binding protein [Methyloradius sp.]